MICRFSTIKLITQKIGGYLGYYAVLFGKRFLVDNVHHKWFYVSLRHIQNGTDLYTVKELLGHSTIQLTERYSHLRPDGLKMAAQNFDEKVIKNNII